MSLKKGTHVWIWWNEEKVIVPAEILDALMDNLWRCGVTTYTEIPTEDPVMRVFTVPESEIFTTREAALNWYASVIRHDTSKRSYDWQFQQEEYMNAFDAEWNKHYARMAPEEDQSVEWQVGDKIWFYDDSDELVKHGILKGTDINGCWEIEYTYIRQDNQTEKELFTRGPGGIWKSAEAAAEAVAEDLRVEIIENSLSLYDEQWEREHGSKQAEDR